MDNRIDKQSETEQSSMKLEWAKRCILNAKGDKAKFKKGMNMLQEACKSGNPEALFVMAILYLDGCLRPKNETCEQRGRKLLFMASNAGSLQARVRLNELCRESYEQNFSQIKDHNVQPHPLMDFEGNPIKIQRTGLFTPIDAVLEFQEEKNVLTFRCNLDFVNLFSARDEEKFKAAVVKGMKAWEGEYQVFGGQQLTVRLELTTKNRLLDSVHIYLMNADGRQLMEDAADCVGNLGADNIQDMMETLATYQNSFAIIGKKWSVKTKKMICIVADEGDEAAYEEIADLTTHEFGHALGLGDLYQSPKTGDGVQRGSYLELDSYSVDERAYHLVMCNHHGMISNNDMEMIVLAFSENAKQNYQRWGGDISKALGKGN